MLKNVMKNLKTRKEVVKLMIENFENFEKDIMTIVQNSTAKMQKIIAVEELSELIKEITKDLRGKESFVLEEYCDCLIMLEQIKIIYNLNEKDIEKVIEEKINRTFDRMGIKKKEDPVW